MDYGVSRFLRGGGDQRPICGEEIHDIEEIGRKNAKYDQNSRRLIVEEKRIGKRGDDWISLGEN